MLAHIALSYGFQYQVHAVEKRNTLEGFDFPALMKVLMEEESLPRTKAQLIDLLQKEGEKWAGWAEGLSDAFLAEPVLMPAGSTPTQKSRLEMILSVKERTPLLAWQREDTVMWIDQAGVAFPPRGEAGVDLIYVQAEGDPPGIVVPEADPKEGESEAAATTATTQAPQNQKRNPVPGEPYITTALVEAIQGLNEIRPSGAPVAYHPRYGLGWNDPQGWKVYFGQEVIDMEEKLNAYQAIVAQVVEKGVHPTLISVEFLHAPFYRLE
jgi:hypothetical protein